MTRERHEPEQETKTCPKCGAIRKRDLDHFTGKLMGFHGTLIFEDPEDPDPWYYVEYTNAPLMLPEMKSLIKQCGKKPVRVTTEDRHLVRVEPIK